MKHAVLKLLAQSLREIEFCPLSRSDTFTPTSRFKCKKDSQWIMCLLLHTDEFIAKYGGVHNKYRGVHNVLALSVYNVTMMPI